jgi:hypothetical protein
MLKEVLKAILKLVVIWRKPRIVTDIPKSLKIKQNEY